MVQAIVDKVTVKCKGHVKIAIFNTNSMEANYRIFIEFRVNLY